MIIRKIKEKKESKKRNEAETMNESNGSMTNIINEEINKNNSSFINLSFAEESLNESIHVYLFRSLSDDKNSEYELFNCEIRNICTYKEECTIYFY